MKTSRRKSNALPFRHKISRYRADIIFLFSGLLFFAFFSLAFAGQIAYDNGGRRDPLIPLAGPNAASERQAENVNPDLKIEGIIFDPKNGSLVLLKGETYGPGDSIGNAVIKAINKNNVIFQQADQEKTVWISEDLIPAAGAKDESQ